jgi:hypothetical protein
MIVPSTHLPRIIIGICLRAAGLRRNIGMPLASCNHALPERGSPRLA